MKPRNEHSPISARACDFEDHSTGTSEAPKGLKWEAPRCVAYYLPDVRVASTKDRQNWVHAMMLDPRLNRGMYTRAVLTRLIGHLHLKTGKCNPMLGTLALDCARNR